jgi:VIT1/CCC1 family predicted Fe2+/Mn2+ transporter
MVNSATPRRVLDPVSRASEVLFGLIMVLTFTLSLGAAESSRDDVRTILIGALGCNLAWAIIDAVMQLMGTSGERRLAVSTVWSIHDAESPAAGRAIVADHIPAAILPALTEADLDRIRLHLCNLPPESLDTRFRREDYLAALGVFLLVFLCLFPVAVPFLFIEDVPLALRISNVVAGALLFLAGFAFGRHVGRPWRTGFLMVVIGAVLVAVALALGG